jgi:RNA polymerase sporulation-specific sigma factor
VHALSESGMNQTQLARLLAGEGASDVQVGSARRLLIKWINNEHSPSPVSARKLALALDRDVSYFLAPERPDAKLVPETTCSAIQEQENLVDTSYRTVLRAIESIRDDYWRCRGLTNITHAVSPASRVHVLLKALDAAISCEDQLLRAEALMHAAEASQGDDTVLAHVIAACDGIHDESALARLLSIVPKHVRRGSPTARRAVELARKLSDPLQKGHLLASLGTLVDSDERRAVVNEIDQLVQPLHSTDAVALLVEAFPLSDQIQAFGQADLLSACRQIDDEELRARRMARLARSPSEHREAAASAAIEAAGMASAGWPRAALLLEIASDLPANRRVEVLRQAIEAITGIDDDLLRADALGLLARGRLLNHDVAASAVRVARTLTEPELEITTIIALLPAIPPSLRPELVTDALVLVEDVVDYVRRVMMTVRLAAMAPGLVRSDVITELLWAVRRLEDPHVRVDLLGRVIAAVPPADQPALASECVAAITKRIVDQWHRAVALVELADRLPEPPPPPPRLLPRLDDIALILRARNGDVEALDALIRRYMGYVRLKASSYFLAGGDAEDLVQEGLIGIYKAVRDFRPDKEGSFRSFAELCVTRQIITAIKTATRFKHAPLNTYVSFEHVPVVQDVEGECTLGDMLPGPIGQDPSTIVISTEELRGLAFTLGTELSPIERDALTLYLEGDSYQAIAEKLRCDSKAVDNALQRVKRKIMTYQKAHRLTV